MALRNTHDNAPDYVSSTGGQTALFVSELPDPFSVNPRPNRAWADIARSQSEVDIERELVGHQESLLPNLTVQGLREQADRHFFEGAVELPLPVDGGEVQVELPAR